MYKCDKCGKVIEDLPKIIDFVPYGSTTTALESTDYDCGCGGQFLDAIKCRVCGCYKHEDDGIQYNEKICDDCLDSIALDFRKVRTAFEDVEEGGIDELAKFIIEYGLREKVSKVIWDYIESERNFKSQTENIAGRISDFILEDRSDFAERLVERGIIE